MYLSCDDKARNSHVYLIRPTTEVFLVVRHAGWLVLELLSRHSFYFLHLRHCHCAVSGFGRNVVLFIFLFEARTRRRRLFLLDFIVIVTFLSTFVSHYIRADRVRQRNRSYACASYLTFPAVHCGPVLSSRDTFWAISLTHSFRTNPCHCIERAGGDERREGCARCQKMSGTMGIPTKL